MKLDLETWNKKDYDNYLKYLKDLSNNDLIKFSESLIFTKYPMLGIKIPKLREIAKEIYKGNYLEFLKLNTDTYFEEVMIYGFVISKIKDENIFDEYFNNYIDKVDNWSLCDSFCNSIKHVRQNEKYFKLFKKLTKTKKEYHVRVGLIAILSNFVTGDYIDDIYEILDNVKLDTYYVNMAKAWLLCECVIKFRDKTINYLKDSKLDDWSYNKGIQKCIESYRVSKEDKEYLKSVKRVK